MDLYNVEGTKYRKKDKVPYYHLKGVLVEVPSLADDKETIMRFLQVCMGVSEDTIRELWDEALSKKQLILDALEEMRVENEGSGNQWQSIAYSRAIREIKKLQVPIVSGTQALNIKGVGKGIAAVIDEVLKSGKLKSREEREEYKNIRERTIEKFMSIWGSSKKVANQWFEEGYREIKDIPPGDMTEQQRLGITYFEEVSKKVPRKYIEKLELPIGGTFTGSYRRGAPDIDRLVMLVPTNGVDIKKIVPKLGYVEHSSGVHKQKLKSSDGEEVHTMEALILLPNKEHTILEIKLVPREIFGAALLFSTGPESFTRDLKEQAAQAGYRLSEEGIFRLTDPIERLDLDEKGIFKLLGMEYLDPEDRF